MQHVRRAERGWPNWQCPGTHRRCSAAAAGPPGVAQRRARAWTTPAQDQGRRACTTNPNPLGTAGQSQPGAARYVATAGKGHESTGRRTHLAKLLLLAQPLRLCAWPVWQTRPGTQRRSERCLLVAFLQMRRRTAHASCHCLPAAVQCADDQRCCKHQRAGESVTDHTRTHWPALRTAHLHLRLA